MNNTITHVGDTLEFDFSPNVALKLEAQAKIYFDDLQNYFNSGVKYDFALWVALKPDKDGNKPDFWKFEEIAENVPSEALEPLMMQLKDIMGFFIHIVVRNLQTTKEKKRELREIWMKPFLSLNPTASES